MHSDAVQVARTVGGLTLAGQTAVGLFLPYERRTRAIANLVQAHQRIAEDACGPMNGSESRRPPRKERLMEQACGSEISLTVPDLRGTGNPRPRHYRHFRAHYIGTDLRPRKVAKSASLREPSARLTTASTIPAVEAMRYPFSIKNATAAE